MYKVIQNLELIAKSASDDKYSLLLHGLEVGAEVLSDFFDGDNSVMVMIDDKELRNNRLNLLSLLTNQSLIVADFSKLS